MLIGLHAHMLTMCVVTLCVLYGVEGVCLCVCVRVKQRERGMGEIEEESGTIR